MPRHGNFGAAKVTQKREENKKKNGVFTSRQAECQKLLHSENKDINALLFG